MTALAVAVIVSSVTVDIVHADAGSGSAVATAGSDSTATPTLAHDPISHPLEAAADAWETTKEYGYVWGGMIILFAIGTALARKADEDHWIHATTWLGMHALPLITGGLAVLGAVLDAKFGHKSWSAVPIALMGAVTLIVQVPKPKPATS